MLFFALSVPVAYLNTTVAIVLWFVAIPAQGVLGRIKPADFDTYFR